MSFGFGIGDFLAVLQLVGEIRQNWKDVPEEYAAIGNEVASLKKILELVNASRDKHFDATHGAALDDVIVQCKTVLADVQKIIDVYTKPSSNILSKNIKRLKADPVDVRHLRDRLVPIIEQFNTIQNSAQIDGIGSIKEVQSNERRLAIANWFSSDAFAQDQLRNLDLRQPGTATWILQHPCYQTWRQKPSQTLFCPGIPGAGKSVLFATIVDDLQKQSRQQSNMAVAYFYCDYKRQNEQSLSHILSALIRQLFQEQNTIPREVLNLYQKHIDLASRPTLNELQSLVDSLIPTHSEVFFLVDALDECKHDANEQTRDKLISHLILMQKKSGVSVNIMATCRPNIVQDFNHCPQIEIRAQTADITMYLTEKVAEIVLCIRDRSDLQQLVIDEIVRIANGMFLLARLHLESLHDHTKPREVLKALKDLPRGTRALEDAYGGVLDRIDQQTKNFKDLARRTLMWVTFAKRELTMRELQEALTIEPGMSDIDPTLDFDNEGIITRVCAGLVTIDPDKNTAKLTHATAQTYLEQCKDRWLPDSGEDIAYRCFTYLSMPVFVTDRMLSGIDIYETAQKYKLLFYIGRHWGHHLKDSDASPDYLLKAWADNKFQHLTTQLVIHSLNAWSTFDSWYPPAQTTPLLHLFAVFDYKVGMEILLRNSHELDPLDSLGRSALHITAYFGCEIAISVLLTQRCILSNLNLQEIHGATPLLMAANKGNTEIVAQLLDREDARPSVNLPNTKGATPLSEAAHLGHAKVMALLLARDDIGPSLNLPGRHGVTPLSDAASKGNSDLVAQLLARDDIGPSVNLPNSNGATPLSQAAFWRNDQVIAQLLAREDIGPSVNLPNMHGNTPLLEAARCGLSKIVAQLLARDDIGPSVNLPNSNGNTPLLEAAGLDHAGITAQLLAREDIGPSVNPLNRHGSTPLLEAAHWGHSKIVAQLLAREDIGPSVSLPNAEGDTPLSTAVAGRYDLEINQMLSKWQDLNLKDAREPRSA